jgi:hypothetical protein
MTGLIFDDDGQRLSPTHAVKNGKRYRYYVSTALITGDRGERPVGRRLPVEALTLDRLRGFFSSAKEISDAVPRSASTPRPNKRCWSGPHFWRCVGFHSPRSSCASSCIAWSSVSRLEAPTSRCGSIEWPSSPG